MCRGAHVDSAVNWKMTGHLLYRVRNGSSARKSRLGEVDRICLSGAQSSEAVETRWPVGECRPGIECDEFDVAAMELNREPTILTVLGESVGVQGKESQQRTKI